MMRLPLFVMAALAGITPAGAYYHFVHYQNSSSPYSPVYEKFDLAALPDKTVTFFVSDSGPTSYTPNDSFPSVLSQIREAAKVWNSVATSDLRVAFGGLETAGTPQNVPSGEVVFEELPPGLLAFAGPSAEASITTGPAGQDFFPIVKSVIHLNIDLTVRPGPSYRESFFTTVVHEMGHALGLQHTFTSATMSIAVTRATSRAKPLDADDIAGISVLYPRGAFPGAFGSITGTVTAGGQGVHLASVVAIMPNGPAISNLTNPDGTYEIDGLPPGNYWVYVHPLPPTANILPPTDNNGNPVPASGPFYTTFYPGTTDPTQFVTIPVTAGATVSGIDFSVQPRSSVEVYDVTTYSYFGQSAVQPAYLNANANVYYQTVVANGTGITSGSDAAAGLTVQVLGGSGPAIYQAYGAPDTSLAIYLHYDSPPASGPQHLLFTLPDDIYVLPAGIQMAQSQPPLVTALNPNADGSVTVTGTGMGPDSQVFFDGLPGQVTAAYTAAGDQSGSGSMTVLPPPGASGQNSTITVFNADGQNSMFLQSDAPPVYSYPQTAAPAANISISALPQGVSAMVDVTTSTMQFVDGLVTLGFGSSDVAVRRVWVLSPSHLIANVTVAPAALLRATVASVISGFQVYEQTIGFQVLPANPSLPIIGLPVPNALPYQNSLYPGAFAAIYGANLAADSGTPWISVAGQPAQILYASPSQINFVVPAGVSTGPAVMQLSNGATSTYPVVMQIDAAPPVIVASALSATAGDSITLTVSNIDPAVASDPSRVQVLENGVAIPSFTIQQATDGSNDLLIQFSLSPSISGSQIAIAITLDGDLSLPVLLDIGAQPASGQ
jgi:Matrixin/IPT/TIG domain